MVARVTLCPEQKEEYMVADLPFIFEKEAKKRGLHQKDLAKALGITPQAYNARKKKNSNGKPKDSFSYGEMLKLFRLLGLSEEERLKLLSP
ncbi:MAG: helix-turn-helix transcriptional regulator [Butyrivibrio sp.]|nr:helix-turn-helix transcriptional regulator [Acetatifactor muris]MCM1561228.1 helix-turn-helix transcriptional regulator [Butyrivibrio sp.]